MTSARDSFSINEPTQTHVYNGMDDRVATTSGTGPTSETRRFIYDLDGRVIGEYGSSALDVKAEFIWLHPPASNENQPFGGDDGIGGYTPLALVTPNAVTAAAEISWVHANHLGVPVLTLDASGNSVTRTGYNLPGFPGQSRTHADLYYNRYRDYDPVTGRYIQADPIGLGGGANPYVYAGNNPVTGVDPDGLNPVALGRGAVAAGEVAGQGLIWWCRSNIALCMRTIAPAAVRVSNACKAVSSALAGLKDGRDDPDIPCRTISGRAVPVGTVAFRPLDTPNRQQHGIVGPHYNIYRANKNPTNGKCFWQSIGAVPAGALPRGAIPIEPFAN